MPIKLPKGFPRRKSSGNALEELQNPPQPSFRVFERPSTASKSFDGGNNLKRVSLGRPLSDGQYVEENSFEGPRPNANLLNRGSGGTNNSSSSGGLYDTSSSSARFSSSSTLPSSSSIEASPDEISSPNLKTQHSLPVPLTTTSQPFSLRAAGRTFSFGRKLTQQSPDVSPLPNISNGTSQDYGVVPRPRGMTETSYASASTATPPKLLDTDLTFGESDDLDGFGNMFDGIGNQRSKVSKDQEARSLQNSAGAGQSELVAPPIPTHAYLGKRLPLTPPPPLDVDRSREIVASPYSCDSHGSQERLMSSSSPVRFDEDDENISYRPRSQIITHSRTMPFQKVDNPATEINTRLDSALRRNSAYASRRASTPLHDNDAMLVLDSINASRRLDRLSGVPGGLNKHPLDGRRAPDDYEDSGLTHTTGYRKQELSVSPRKITASTSSQGARHPPAVFFDSQRTESLDTTPRAMRADLAIEEDSLLFDPSFQASVRSAEAYQAIEPSPTKEPSRSKVMTPAQFERYKREQELSRTKSDASMSENSEDDNENYDDDEAERTRELVKQRRKQEAHLAVYRQQMMKVTGEQPSTRQQRPGFDRMSMSSPNLGAQMSNIDVRVNPPTESGKISEDEDDDIPLGILAAHGFPTKERPPNPLDRMRSTPTIRYTSETYPPPPSSVAGGSTAGGPRGSLPPFARNLPKDPYYGASIVTSANREAMSLGNTGGSSVHGEPQPNLPPGGLVGVIASEERARAARRGSPNAQGGYGVPTGGNIPLPPGMSPPGFPPGTPLSAGDQAQIQMSQQMTQMMQMQMQWMQQMMAMQGGTPSGQQSQMPIPPQHSPMPKTGFLSPPGAQMNRPMSMGSNVLPNNPAIGQQRAMSMLDPNVSVQWQQMQQGNTSAAMMSGALGPPQGYSPSIAPSERSNIGQPSRYRPVSIASIDEAPKKALRASTFTSGSATQGWSHKPSGLKSTVKVVEGHRKTPTRIIPGSDDDEEEGWEEMKAKREKKKGNWRSKRRDDQGLGDVFYPGT